MSIYNQLSVLNLISWPTLLIGLEKGFISEKDIERYATTLLLHEFKGDKSNIALLASATEFSLFQIKDMIISELDCELIKNKELEKLRLASLLSLDAEPISDAEKCSKLQELYAIFDYPEDMRECSIYLVENEIPPLKAMRNVIKYLKKKLNLT